MTLSLIDLILFHVHGMLVLCVGLYFQSLDYPISNQELQRNVNQIVMQAKILYSFDILVQQIKTYDILLLRSEEHTSELQSRFDLVCRLLLEIKKSHN